jgi:hypothetical protein
MGPLLLNLGKPLQNFVVSIVCSPKATSNILKVSVAFFHSLKQHMIQTCFSFNSCLSFLSVPGSQMSQQTLYLIQVPQSHMPHAYSKDEMTYQAVTVSACSGRSCMEQVSSHGQCRNYSFCISLSVSVFQFKYILHRFSCKANLQ